MTWIRALILAAVATLVAPTFAAHGQGLIRDVEIEEMAWSYSTPIFKAAGLDPATIEIYLVGDASMNAFVIPGQRMFLHAGIITAADTPNELIGVIAHETGHMAGSHAVRRGIAATRSSLGPMLATLAAGILAAAAGEGGAAVGLLASSQQFAAIEQLNQFRQFESAADQAGLRYLTQTNQSAQGLVTFFDRFRDQEVFASPSLARLQRLDPYFRTHPLSSDRVEYLRAQLATQPSRDAVDTPEHVRMLEMAQAKLHGFFDQTDVVFRRFPETNTSDPALYARAVAHHRLGEVDAAVALMDELIARDADNPYFHELKGQILQENGRPAAAIGPYERAVALKPDAALLHTGLAKALLDQNSLETTQRAMDHLTTALSLEPYNSYAWYQRSRAHDALGETALARYASAERFFAIGDLRRAASFASSARPDLERGSPEWLRTADILNVVRLELQEAQGRRR